MGKIGFLRNTNIEPEHEETLQTIERTIQTEILTIGQFQKETKKELKALEHLQDNFRLIEKFVESIEKLQEKRQAAVTKIRFLAAKRPAQINIFKIKIQFEIISRLQQELNPMLQKAKEEIARLLVEESHIIYAGDRQTRAIMDTIDTASRDLQVAIRIIQAQMEATYNELNQIHSTITELERERLMTQPKT